VSIFPVSKDKSYFYTDHGLRGHRSGELKGHVGILCSETSKWSSNRGKTQRRNEVKGDTIAKDFRKSEYDVRDQPAS
jgi:hypothetical protein